MTQPSGPDKKPIPDPTPDVRAQFQALDRRLEFQGIEAIDAAALEAFEYAYPGRDIEIATATDEFTSVCPFSGLPDFGRLTISYVPDRRCIELRSLKYYLISYRNVGIFYEHLANRMLEDLVRACQPKRMTVVCEMTIRGGLHTTIRAEYENAECGARSAE
jgi:7-cyano-7-deazaguanine reductase